MILFAMIGGCFLINCIVCLDVNLWGVVNDLYVEYTTV
jgi:hypothetical protein